MSAENIFSEGDIRRILVIAAHPDDEILGCGGAIANHTSNGDDVSLSLIHISEPTRPY